MLRIEGKKKKKEEEEEEDKLTAALLYSLCEHFSFNLVNVRFFLLNVSNTYIIILRDNFNLLHSLVIINTN